MQLNLSCAGNDRVALIPDVVVNQDLSVLNQSGQWLFLMVADFERLLTLVHLTTHPGLSGQKNIHPESGRIQFLIQF